MFFVDRVVSPDENSQVEFQKEIKLIFLLVSTAETITISKFHTCQLLVFNQYVLRRILSDILGLSPWPMPDNITIYRYCLLRAFPTTGIV